MNWLDFIESLITPPGLVIILMLAALFFHNRITSRFVIMISITILYTMSTPLIANRLQSHLDKYPVLDLNKINDKQAIVVLSAGMHYAPEYERFVPNKESLARATYAAQIQQTTRLPLLISGGMTNPLTDELSEAKTMALFIQKLGATVSYLEQNSTTTRENALNATLMLKNEQIERIILITSAIHMKRSVIEFERYNMQVLAAPMLKTHYKPFSLADLLPTKLQQTQVVLHELLGIQWYRLRHWLQ